MSVVIEKLILPKSDGVITYSAEITIYPNGKVYFRDNNHDFLMTEISTPHGRLIDADKLMQWIEHVYGDKDIIKFITDDIKRQPTIVEAEVSE